MPTQQPIFANSNAGPSASATRYLLVNNRASAWQTTQSVSQQKWPTGGDLKQWSVNIDTAPGAGKKWRFAVQVNGTSSTTIFVDIRDTQTQAIIEVDQSITAGDKVNIVSIPQGTPTAFTVFSSTLVWQPTIDDEYVILGTSSDALAAGATEYNRIETPVATTAWSTTQADMRQLVAPPGTLKKFACELSATPGAGENYVFTLQTAASEGTPSDSSVTVTLDNADFDKIDSSNTVATTAGAVATIKVVGSGSAAAVTAKWSLVFTPTTTGEIPLIGGTSDDLSNSATEYNFSSGDENWNATEASADFKVINATITVTELYVELNDTPGASTDYTFNFRKNAASEASLQAVIENTTKSDNATGATVSVGDGNTIALQCVPTGPPTTRDAYWGLTFTYAGITTPTEPAFAKEVIHFQKDNTGTANAIDHVQLSGNFTPKAIILVSAFRASAGIADRDYNLSYGFSDGTNDRAVVSFVNDGDSGTSQAHCSTRDDGVAFALDPTPAVVMAGTVDGFLYNAFRIKWTTNTSTAKRFTAVVLGGTQLSFEALTWDTDTDGTAHTQDVTTPTTANADFGIFATTRQGSMNGIGNHGRIGIGFSDGTSDVAVAGTAQNGAATSNADRQFYSAEAVALTLNGSDQGAASIEFDAAGFNAVWDANKTTTALKVITLLAKGGQWEVGTGQDRDTTEGTGVEPYTTSFQPEVLQIVSHNNVNADSWQNNNVIDIGSSDGTTEGNVIAGDADGLSTTDCCANHSITKILERVSNVATPSLGATANVNGFNATDFSLNFTAVDTAPQDRWFGWWVAAEAAAASAVPVLDEGMLTGGFQPLAGGLY